MEIARDSEAYEGRLSDLVVKIRETIRRRWLTLALVSAAVFGLGVAAVFMMTPQYSSSVRVRIDPTRNPLQSNPQSDSQALNPEAIETEVTVLSSVDLAREVVRRQQLERDPEFTKKLDSAPDAASMTAAERQTAIANELLKRLSVGREKLSYILTIKYTSPNATKSATIANAFANAYIDTRVGSKIGTAERQSTWFKQRLDELGGEVNAADARAAAYRAKAGIVEGGANNSQSGTITDQQIAPLSGQLATAESEAAAARASLQAAQRQISSGGLDSVAEVLSSPVIADLRRQRTEILRSVGEVQARYGDKHPEAIRVRDQLASVDAQLKEESQRVISSLQANANAADARADSMRGAMKRLEGQQASNTRNGVLAQSLDRDAAAKRAAYDRMSQMSLDSTQAAQNQIAQAEIIDRAAPSPTPSFPNKPLFIALAFIVALAAGTTTIAVQEMLVSGLRTVEDVETQLGIPVLSAIPKVPRMANPADLLLEKPTSLFAESLRIARAAIIGVRSTTPPKVIALTSALPSEGKTTTALAFARTLAANNARTLLLECDVRRAAMRALVGNPPTGPGIVEVLHGEATLEQAITPGDVPNLDHLLVSKPYFSSGDLFGGGQMETMLTTLRGRYDQIVLDLPPLVGLADGRFLAVLADATALIIRWDATPTPAVASALAWLKADGANPVGAIFTMVDASAEAIGGLYYSKKYSAYYQAA